MATKDPDPQAIFRLAVCFDFSGAMLCNYTGVYINKLAKSGQFSFTETTEREPIQTSGGILLPVDQSTTMNVLVPKESVAQTPTAAPMFVVQAFATELYLKCLLVLDGAVPWGHELYTLFGELKPDRKIRIEHFYKEHNDADVAFFDAQQAQPDVIFSLEFSLREMNKAFEKWRYAYESPGPQNSFLGQPWLAVRSAILEIKPEWDAIGVALGSPPTFLDC